MKCPYCGGEVPSQSVKCPYCDAVNPEGVAFQEEIQERIERNRLLRPFLIKQKTPELKQRMLTRMIVILMGINVALIAFSLGIFLWENREERRAAAKDSQAKYYETFFGENRNYYYDEFLRRMNEFVDMAEEGQIPEREDILSLLDRAYDSLYYMQDEEKEFQQEILFNIKAFFMGYVGLTSDEMECFEPDENGVYDRYMENAVAEQVATVIEERMKTK
ncbi:MAG: hypothetical protein PUG54_01120 [Firmicutes bacterium]|nr:hypothetical protein [Bacillota bacterium]